MHGDRTQFLENEYVKSLSEEGKSLFRRIISKPFCKIRSVDDMDIVRKLIDDRKIIVFDGWAITTAYYFFHRRKRTVRILKRVERHNAYETLVSLEKHGRHWEEFLRGIGYGKKVEVVEDKIKGKPKDDVPTKEKKIHVKKTPEQLKAEFLASF